VRQLTAGLTMKRASLRGEGGSQTGPVMSSRMLNNVTLNLLAESFNQHFATFKLRTGYPNYLLANLNL